MKKIIMINPPSLTIIPIGLEIIASYFDFKKQEYKELCDYSVLIIDGTGKSEEDVIAIFNDMKEDVEYVGISSWQSNHRIAMNLLSIIKKLKPDIKTWVGGPNCYHNYRQIMNNNQFIDFVVRGPGEISLVDLVLNKNYSRVTNLVYRDDEFIRLSEKQDIIDMRARPLFTMKHIVNRKDYFNINELTGFPISNIFGCIQASQNKKRCSFCSLPSLKTCVDDYEKFWKQIEILNKEYGIKHFYECGDSFIIGKYPEKILAAKPKDLNVALRVYASPDQITFDSLKILKQIGVTNVFMGVENINPNLQSHLIKDFSEDTIDIILKQLKELNMKALIGYMYGLPGETRATMENSNRFLRYIVDNYKDSIGLILNNAVVPIMGSKLFESIIISDEICKQYQFVTGEVLAETDSADYNLLQKLMIDYGDYNFSYDDLLNEVASINSYLSDKIPTFDWKKDT